MPARSGRGLSVTRTDFGALALLWFTHEASGGTHWLVSNATQFFSIFSRGDSFVFYQFQVGGEVLQPNQGRVHVGIDVFEAEPQCDTPPGTTRPGRVLLETNEAATQQLSLRDVFNAIVKNSGLNDDGLYTPGPLLIGSSVNRMITGTDCARK